MSPTPPVTSDAALRGGWRGFDWPLMLIVLALSLWGALTVVSATLAKDDVMSARPPASVGTSLTPDSAAEAAVSRVPAIATPSPRSDAVKQGMWIALGMTLLIGLALFDFQWLIYLQGWLYVLNLGLLTMVLAFGHVINGAKSWFKLGPFALQPAEFSKFFVLVTLAGFLCRRQERIREPAVLLTSLLYIAPVLLLIMKQPDFGTMMAIGAIWFGMLFFGGARLRHLGLVVFCVVALFGIAWKVGILKPHQVDRLTVFLNPSPSSAEAKRAAYQVTQSQIAIGAGQVTGQGWGQGMQKRGGWVPENNTDFIFTVVAEELGFAGAALLIMFYLALLTRTAFIATATENYFGTLIAGGFTALLAYHAIINLGMTMRVMPITGVPLPFFSYGGSSYIAFAAGVGLLQSIAIRQRRMQSW